MRYDIEADWHLLNACNYRCAYCFLPPAVLGEKLQTVASPRQWQTAFHRTRLKWLLHMTGGEPSIYPHFVELCRLLTEDHFISINSNLTNACLVDFAEKIEPKRVCFINAGMHLEERDFRRGHAKFLHHAQLLHAKGFPVLVSLVVTPTALANFEAVIAMLQPFGLFPVPKLLRGQYEGRSYPSAYTSFDRLQFRLFSGLARQFYQPLLARMGERPSIDMFNDDAFLHGVPSYTDLLCDAGFRFVHISPDGDVRRCGPVWKLGNILDGTFARRLELAPCNARHCFYFCRKYSKPSPPDHPSAVQSA